MYFKRRIYVPLEVLFCKWGRKGVRLQKQWGMCNMTCIVKLFLYHLLNERHQLFIMFIFFWFVCVGFTIPLENFSLIRRRHHYRRRAANFDLCSALMVIEQWGFFSVSHLLWYGASFYNGHLRGPVTLTPIAERLPVELSLLVLWLRSVADGIWTPNLLLAGPTLQPTVPTPGCLFLSKSLKLYI